MATWTAQVGTEAPRSFVSAAKWRVQRRPEVGQRPEHTPSLFRGQTIEDADRRAAGACLAPADGALYCSGCGGLIISAGTKERHRASAYHGGHAGGDDGSVALLERPDAVAWVLESFRRDPGFRNAVLAGAMEPPGAAVVEASAPAWSPAAASASASASSSAGPTSAADEMLAVEPVLPEAPSYNFGAALL